MSLKETLERQNKVAIRVEVPRDLRDKAQRKSKATGIAVSFILRKALSEWAKDAPDIKKGGKK